VAKALHPATGIREAWALFRDLAATAPDHVMLAFGAGLGDVAYGLPDELAGKPTVTLSAYHSGDAMVAEKELQPLIDHGPPLFASIKRQSYIELQRIFDDSLGWAHRVYTKGGFTDDLPNAALDGLAEQLATATATDSFGLWAQGGAIARVPEDSTAFTGRAARFQMSSECAWDDPALDESHIGWGRATFAVVEPFSRTGRYVNDIADSVWTASESVTC